MKKYFKIEIATQSPGQGECLIAELSEINFYAFEQEINYLNAYIREEDFNENRLNEILSDKYSFIKTIIEEDNWNKLWENSIQPVIVNDFVAIRPSFREKVKGVKHDLVITPKMSFGTGHHATTFLMIELMEKIDFRNKSVLDFGTGTGILSILAEKLGADEIVAIDNDEWSIRNATENKEANDCKHIRLALMDSPQSLAPFDTILANINLNVLSDNANSISSLLKENGCLLLSGFLEKDEIEIINIFERRNIRKLETLRRNGWIAIYLRKHPV